MSEPILETERLILRPPRLEDLDAWAEFYQDADAVKFIGGAVPKSVSWRSLCTAAGSWALQGFSMFSVIEKSSGRWVGRIGAHHPYDWPGTEVGWAVVRDCWGKGYAYEAASASMDFAVDQLGWDEVIHCIDPENHASRRLAERLGSTILRQATMPPPVETHLVDIWGQTAVQWRASRAVSI